MRRRVWRLTFLPLVAALLATLPTIGDAEEAAKARLSDGADLSRRLSSGPVVILGTVVDSSIKATVSVERVYRAPGEVPDPLEIAYRGKNAERRRGAPRFEPLEGEQAIFVLERWQDYYGELGDEDLYRPAWNYRSRIPVPREGREALVSAVERLVRFKDSENRQRAEADLRDWLSGRNPWLIDAALSHVALHGPPDHTWARHLVERARSPNPDRRRLALQAIGIGLARGRLADEPERSSATTAASAGERTAADQRELCRRALIQAARTDEDPAVRREAVRALGRSGLQEVLPVLEVIASRDSNQEVRYEAETILLRRRGADRR